MIIVSEFPKDKGDWFSRKPMAIMAIQMGYDFVTLEGKKGQAGDYLISGVKGVLYPCKQEIFEETYEKIESYEYSEDML